MRKILIAMAALGMLATGASAQVERWQAEGWETDFSKHTVAFRSIISGGPPRDGIPPIDEPVFAAAGQGADIPDVEPVVAFVHEGVARAYPIRYLMWHEIVNDTVGGLPVTVTFCPLCNSAIVFDRTVGGEVTTFGTSGKLRNSDLIMWDRATQTWWQQFDGEGIVGERAGQFLTALPSSMISFAQFLERYPDGEVLQPDPKRASSAGRNPYAGYDSSRPFLFRGELPDGVEPMMRLAVVQKPEPVAVTLPYLRENAPVRVGDLEFTWEAGQVSALDASRISQSRDVGTIEVFRVDGDKREPVVYLVSFAFAAHAFLPGLNVIDG